MFRSKTEEIESGVFVIGAWSSNSETLTQVEWKAVRREVSS